MNLKQIRASVTYQATYKHAQSLGLTKDTWAKMIQAQLHKGDKLKASCISFAVDWAGPNFHWFELVTMLGNGRSRMAVRHRQSTMQHGATYVLNGVKYPVSSRLLDLAAKEEYYRVNKF